MSEPVFIARQDTLDEKIIPAQLLNDYKLYGEKSFVFNTPELWEKMMLHPYTANDRRVNGEALEYVLTIAAPGGTASLSNWLAMICELADAAGQGLFTGIETAQQLAQSVAAMAAVSNSETAMAAVSNSETAMAAVSNSETAMTAVSNSETAMAAVFNSETAMTAVFNSETAMTAVFNSETAMTAVSNSETAMAAVSNSETAMAAVSNSETAMAAVTESETAMNAICTVSSALSALMESPYYEKYIQNNSMAIAKAAVALANSVEFSDIASVAAMAENSTAMSAVAASETAMSVVAASETAMNAVAASSTAMNAVAASSTAMNAVAASNVAIKAIEGAATALAALASSPLAQTVDYEFTNSWIKRRTGKVFLIRWIQHSFSSTSYRILARYTLDGNGALSCTLSDCNGKYYNCKRFMDSITNFCDYSNNGTATYKFIPCS